MEFVDARSKDDPVPPKLRTREPAFPYEAPDVLGRVTQRHSNLVAGEVFWNVHCWTGGDLDVRVRTYVSPVRFSNPRSSGRLAVCWQRHPTSPSIGATLLTRTLKRGGR